MSDVKLCECGCGSQAPPAPYTNRARGWIEGQPKRFIHGHNTRGMKRAAPTGADSKCWRGGRRLLTTGYLATRVVPGRQAVYRHDHVLVVERILGRRLPDGAIVHHVDENKTNNVPSNLVVLQSRREHIELHRKLRVLRAGGDPWTDRMCCNCHAPKPSTEFYVTAAGAYGSRCKECSRANARRHRERAA